MKIAFKTLFTKLEQHMLNNHRSFVLDSDSSSGYSKGPDLKLAVLSEMDKES